MALDNFWTPDKVRDLQSGIDQGLTATKIAKCLGTTKNSVISKCARLELKLQFRVIAAAKREVREIGQIDNKWVPYGRPRKEDFLPYDGPTSMERLDALNRHMDEAMALPVKHRKDPGPYTKHLERDAPRPSWSLLLTD